MYNPLDKAPALTYGYWVWQEQAQLAALREQTASEAGGQSVSTNDTAAERDFEGGFGGLEEFEDRYATTSGEH